MSKLITVIKFPKENSFLSLINLEKNENLILLDIDLPNNNYNIELIQVDLEQYNKNKYYIVDENNLIEKPLNIEKSFELNNLIKEKISQEIECFFGKESTNIEININKKTNKSKHSWFFFIKKIWLKQEIALLEKEKKELIERKNKLLEKVKLIKFNFD